MPTRDPRVDAYIARAPEFARPILEKLRAAVHAAVRDVEETIKWGSPAYVKKGILCSTPAFKHHVAVWFHKGALLEDPKGLLEEDTEKASMRAMKLREGEPIDVRGIKALLKAAAAIDEKGLKAPPAERRRIIVPKDLQARLEKNARARQFFESLAPSHRREYVDWIAEAKREETRARRLEQTMERLSRGERRNEKYR